MTLAIDPDTIIAASPDTVMSDVDGEIMLVCIVSGYYFGLDSVGSEIWRRLQIPTRFADLSEGLRTHFKGDGSTIEREALDFVSKLAERGLVRGVAAG